MTTEQRQQTMFIGIDVHKDTHTAVGVSPFGEKLFEITVGNYQSDFDQLRQKVELTKGSLSPYFGLEDCQGYGERLSSYLHDNGERILAVPSVMVDRQRQKETHPEKSDSLDAFGVAKVMMQNIDSLPAYTISEEAKKAKQIKEISIDREYIVEERTRIKNHLHNLLHRIYNSEYRVKYKDPFSLKALKHWSKSKPKCDQFLLRSMKRKIKRLIDIHYEILDLEKEMETLLNESYTIQTASGCGSIVAGMIIGEIGDINRFHSPGALAKYAGCSPRECSSGKNHRHRKTKGGNRRLNCAFHRMALSQISRSGNDLARTYFKRKILEGKSKQQALVCLRRQMVNIIWCMLKNKTNYNPRMN
ncbi:MAG: IS110 family transposase [Patescibacteria group bacterium]